MKVKFLDAGHRLANSPSIRIVFSSSCSVLNTKRPEFFECLYVFEMHWFSLDARVKVGMVYLLNNGISLWKHKLGMLNCANLFLGHTEVSFLHPKLMFASAVRLFDLRSLRTRPRGASGSGGGRTSPGSRRTFFTLNSDALRSLLTWRKKGLW